MTNTADLTLIRFPELSKILGGRSRSAIYEGIAKGTIPPPVRLPGFKLLAWRRADIEAWLAAAQVSASPTPTTTPRRGKK